MNKITLQNLKRSLSANLNLQSTRIFKECKYNIPNTHKISGGRARKVEWKGAEVRTEYGWSAEIAIPFSILNYHSESRNFGINFLRYQHRTDELSRWADLTPQFKREKMGVLSGLELPDLSKNKPWTIMPYALAGVNLNSLSYLVIFIISVRENLRQGDNLLDTYRLVNIVILFS